MSEVIYEDPSGEMKARVRHDCVEILVVNEVAQSVTLPVAEVAILVASLQSWLEVASFDVRTLLRNARVEVARRFLLRQEQGEAQ